MIHYLYFIGEQGFGGWSNWSVCNLTCNEGVQNRSRVCENEALGCFGKTSQTKTVSS